MRRWWMLLLALAVCGVAGAETRERMAKEYQLYREFSGAPVNHVTAFRLYDWKPLGQSALAVWTRGHQSGVYLLEVDRPCPGLDWARTIGITDGVNTIHAKFDRVKFVDGPRGPVITCLIREIRPVDYKALRAARKARG